MKVCSVLLLWIFSASEGYAVQAPRAAAKTCDPHTTSIRKLMQQARALGGPVAKRVKKKLSSVQTRVKLGKRRALHVERGCRRSACEDGQAIQNDAPIAHASAMPDLALRALGIVAHVLEPQIFSCPSSPQSPRGPPAAAA